MAVSVVAGVTLAIVGAGHQLVYIAGSLICAAESAYGWIFLVAKFVLTPS